MSPTATGKPKVGERIVLVDDTGQEVRGTVLRRFDGLLWGLQVRWDSGRVSVLGDASWYARRGKLIVEGD